MWFNPVRKSCEIAGVLREESLWKIRGWSLQRGRGGERDYGGKKWILRAEQNESKELSVRMEGEGSNRQGEQQKNEQQPFAESIQGITRRLRCDERRTHHMVKEIKR